MHTKTKLITAAVVVAAGAVAGGIGAMAAVADDDGTEVPITGDAYDRATDAALQHVGQGTVTETEFGDEEGLYEVEVTLDDGSQVDVHLDEAVGVIGVEGDDDTGSDDG